MAKLAPGYVNWCNGSFFRLWMLNMFSKLISRLSSKSTSDLIKIPFVTGLLLMGTSIVLLDRTPQSRNLVSGLLIPLGFFAWGFAGIPMIIRKEMPWLIIIKGWFAVLEGIAILVTCWGVAIILSVVLLSAR